MWTKTNNDGGAQAIKETLASYEEATKEFALNAAEFLQHIELLNKARDAYQRAMGISSNLRDTLDSGDETLRTLMTQLEQAVQVQLANDAEKKAEAAKKVENIRTIGEKVDAARA